MFLERRHFNKGRPKNEPERRKNLMNQTSTPQAVLKSAFSEIPADIKAYIDQQIASVFSVDANTFKLFVEDDALMPTYAKEGDSGFDLRANIPSSLIIQPGQQVTVGTGVYIELPVGREIQIRPRSGLAHKNGLTVLNAPGTIDSGFRNEIGVILLNTSKTEPFLINRADRIAQGVIVNVVLADLAACRVESRDALGESKRALTGFGSSGVK